MSVPLGQIKDGIRSFWIPISNLSYHDDVEQHKNREFFISVAHEYIKRPGVSELLAYLNQKTDFFWAPGFAQCTSQRARWFVPALHQCFRNRFAHLQIGVTALCVLGSKSGK